jgi:hypothetical protein
MTYRSTASFAVGGVEPRFTCIICGAERATRQYLEVRSMCCLHDGEHEYEYGHCIECGVEQDYEPGDDDVSLFGIGSDGPIGITASAMNGNASERHQDPAGWANWVRFCEANGHP